MRKSIVYKRCEKLVDTLREVGYENEISLCDLRLWIARTIGANRETLKSYLKNLTLFGMIQPKRDTPGIFLIKPRKVTQVMLSPEELRILEEASERK